VLGRIMLAILTIVGVVEVLLGWSAYDGATAVFQQIARIIWIGLGFILIAVCVGFASIHRLAATPRMIMEPGVEPSRGGGVGPGLR
jgi:hypothetical protein